ncbi:adenosylcobyric acid synthase (glutamine-hydrolysing) [Desulfacinum hydrothermale DSM 13146]|uniref:Cobyric acid synthase n=2 Tax=Desulfacinum hydrothermale TaxID=109258 RepID=A0A1W1XNG8_9BACT|nr:adenosylcobyric acid synthase (glutamine-hydrolysing) [Desulfacinum hydrothermale DSM 13146]
MFLGTGSDVGKSVLAAAFCRIFKQDGLRVAPFKAQNMALNSYITPEGGEMGRAQVVQAEAAGIEPHVDMNPILLKPTSTMGSQVIVLGKAVGNLSAKDYYATKKRLVPVVREAFERLSKRYDIVVLEGAGSAVELNLKEHDLVNLAMARMARAPSILVGDIDRGGIFAALLGSYMLMDPDEQDLLAGFMVNKLRGDPDLFTSGVDILEARSGKPVLGVVPHFDHIALPEEDSVALGRRMGRRSPADSDGKLALGVVRLPFLSNYTDFDCFEHDPGVELAYFDQPGDVFRFDAVVLPGSKNTLEDMLALERSGMADAVRAYFKAGGVVVGICGGYQMLGERITDPHGVESRVRETPGLGLLPMATEMAWEKVTTQVMARLHPDNRLGGRDLSPSKLLHGYEIHMGRSRPLAEGVRACFRILSRNGRDVSTADADDGLSSTDGRVWGTYIHGIFDNDAFRRAFLSFLEERSHKRARPEIVNYGRWKEAQYDLLADHVRSHCDMERIYRIVGI